MELPDVEAGASLGVVLDGGLQGAEPLVALLGRVGRDGERPLRAQDAQLVLKVLLGRQDHLHETEGSVFFSLFSLSFIKLLVGF